MLQRLFYRSYRVTGFHHWLWKRFTPAGIFVVACAGMSAALGVDTNETMAYQAFAFLLGLLVIGGLSVPFFRMRFHVNRILPRFGSVGVPLVYFLEIKHPSRLPQFNLLVSEKQEDPRPSLNEFLFLKEPEEDNRNFFDRTMKYYRWMWLVNRKRGAIAREQSLPALLPRKINKVSLEISPTRRGRLQLKGILIARPDPFGLVKSFVYQPREQSILVLPRRYALPHLAMPNGSKYPHGGVSLASSIGESEEFAALRDYRPGDPPRRIHWKSFAKTGKPIIKEFQDEFFVRHALVLDTFNSGDDANRFEAAISVAASFVAHISTQESLLDLLFVGPKAFSFTAGRGVAQNDRMLEILACVELCLDLPFVELERMVVSHAREVSGFVCVLLNWDENRQQLVRKLVAAGVPLLVVIMRLPGEPVPAPGPMAGDPAHFHAVDISNLEEELARL
ncbi:MAG: hypothetical protein JWN25_1254 [Verrucomicrobiales bacterium]|nr:hypothetical protein [Verrucomicrobiales bacterium]